MIWNLNEYGLCGVTGKAARLKIIFKYLQFIKFKVEKHVFFSGTLLLNIFLFVARMCAGVCSFPFVAGVVREMMKLMDDSDSFRHDDTGARAGSNKKGNRSNRPTKIARHSLHLYRRAQLYRQHLHNSIQMRSPLGTWKFHKCWPFKFELGAVSILL